MIKRSKSKSLLPFEPINGDEIKCFPLDPGLPKNRKLAFTKKNKKPTP
jgi:hypothetical protein